MNWISFALGYAAFPVSLFLLCWCVNHIPGLGECKAFDFKGRIVRVEAEHRTIR